MLGLISSLDGFWGERTDVSDPARFLLDEDASRYVGEERYPQSQSSTNLLALLCLFRLLAC